MQTGSNSILLVEDNEDNRIIYATALRYAGYDGLRGDHRDRGGRSGADESPDLILMDISVPELDGWEATAILKADPTTKHIPIIAVTAHALAGRSRSAAFRRAATAIWRSRFRRRRSSPRSIDASGASRRRTRRSDAPTRAAAGLSAVRWLARM